MKCPFCAHLDDKVIDSREGRSGDTIRRRRECLKCSRRFTTYERIDEIPYMVIKKDGRRERFERQKILQGLLKACEKRPVPMAKLAALVDEVESRLAENSDRELSTREIGELLMSRLRPWTRSPTCASRRSTAIFRTWRPSWWSSRTCSSAAAS